MVGEVVSKSKTTSKTQLSKNNHKLTIEVGEVSERIAVAKIAFEYAEYGARGIWYSESELYEFIVYKNAEGFAVIESHLCEGHDELRCYKIGVSGDEVSDEELQKYLDEHELPATPEVVAEFLIQKTLKEMLEEVEGDLKELIRRALDNI